MIVEEIEVSIVVFDQSPSGSDPGCCSRCSGRLQLAANSEFENHHWGSPPAPAKKQFYKDNKLYTCSRLNFKVNFTVLKSFYSTGPRRVMISWRTLRTYGQERRKDVLLR